MGEQDHKPTAFDEDSLETTAAQAAIYDLPVGYKTLLLNGTTYCVYGDVYYRPIQFHDRIAYVVVRRP